MKNAPHGASSCFGKWYKIGELIVNHLVQLYSFMLANSIEPLLDWGQTTFNVYLEHGISLQMNRDQISLTSFCTDIMITDQIPLL